MGERLLLRIGPTVWEQVGNGDVEAGAPERLLCACLQKDRGAAQDPAGECKRPVEV